MQLRVWAADAEALGLFSWLVVVADLGKRLSCKCNHGIMILYGACAPINLKGDHMIHGKSYNCSF